MNKWLYKIVRLCLFLIALAVVLLIISDLTSLVQINFFNDDKLEQAEDTTGRVPVTHSIAQPAPGNATSHTKPTRKPQNQEPIRFVRAVNTKADIRKVDFESFLKSKPFKTQETQLAWIKLRIQRMASVWQEARQSLYSLQPEVFASRKQILVFPGLLSEYSLYDFSKNAFKGGYLGELVQWSDLIAAVFALGHDMTLIAQKKIIQNDVDKTGKDFDIVYTDYIGLHVLRDLWLFPKFKCKLRLIDSFGTEPLYNLRTQTLKPDTWEMFSNWMFEDTSQVMTSYPHTPDNSFLGYVVEIPTVTNSSIKRKNQGVLYGKESYFYDRKDKYLNWIADKVELHATVKDKLPPILNRVKNHGILKFEELQQLLLQSKIFVGMGFPYDGPAPVEALAHGCVFLQPRFNPPHSPSTVSFFKGKPTSRSLTSQHPYLENFVGEPYVYTVDMTNKEEIQQVVSKVLAKTDFNSFVPYEFTAEGFLERLGVYIQKQNFCDGLNIALHKSASASSLFGSHKATEPIDGKREHNTCFWSESKVSSWWQLDIGQEKLIKKIRIINMFDWYLVKSWGVQKFMAPFQVQLLSADKSKTQSRKYTDQRLLYIWDDIESTAQYIRIESVDYKSARYFVICAVDVYVGTKEEKSFVWPDLSQLQIQVSALGDTCTLACRQKGLVCERSYFKYLNKYENLANYFRCEENKTMESDNYALPGFSQQDKACLVNTESFLFSCAGHSSGVIRLCPCRQFRKGQVALPLS